jgi:hypothetical protein
MKHSPLNDTYIICHKKLTHSIGNHRLEDVETTALRHGKKIIAKLEERLRFLEAELCKTLLNSRNM